MAGDGTMTVAPYGAAWEQWAQWVSAMPVSRQLGLRCAEVDKGRVKLVLDGSDWYINPTGAVHGGIVIACADQAFGAVVSTVLQPGVIPATSTFTSDFLRPAFPPLEFHAVVDRVGRTTYAIAAVPGRQWSLRATRDYSEGRWDLRAGPAMYPARLPRQSTAPTGGWPVSNGSSGSTSSNRRGRPAAMK